MSTQHDSLGHDSVGINREHGARGDEFVRSVLHLLESQHGGGSEGDGSEDGGDGHAAVFLQKPAILVSRPVGVLREDRTSRESPETYVKDELLFAFDERSVVNR